MSRTIAVGAFLYALVLVLTGGFEVAVGPISVRSHEIERSIGLAIVAMVAGLMADERAAGALHTLSRRAAAVGALARPSLLRTLGVLAVAAPGLWLVARVVRAMAAETPSGDMALLELYTIHAAHHDLFLGPYSRFGWHHPGPAMFYVFAPLYELTGARYESLRWSAFVFNMATLAATLAIVRRSAGRALAFAVVVGLGLYLLRVPDLLASPWNPHLLVLPLALLVTACAAIVDGEPRYWPLVAALASFLVQTHLSVAPTVAVTLAMTVWLVANHSDAALARRHWFWANLCAWVVVVMWMLPLADELTSAEGNLRTIGRFFLGRPMATPSLREAFAAAFKMLSAPLLPDFTLAWGAHAVRTVSVVGLVVALGTLLAVPWTVGRLNRRGDRFGSALAILGLTASLVALWSISESQGELLDQLVFWITIVGVVNMACLAAAAGPSVAERLVSRVRVSAAVTTAALWLVLAAAAVDGTVHLYQAHKLAFRDPAVTRIQSASVALKDYLARERLHRPLIRISRPAWGDAAGVVLTLQKSGTPVSVERDWVFMFGRQHAATGDEDCDVIFADPGRRRALSADGRYALVAEWPEVSVHVARLAPTLR